MIKKYSFDEITNRRNTGCIKYDMAPAADNEDIIPLWVADMDFPVLPEVQQALHDTVDQGIYGYSFPEDDYFHAVQGWMKRRHDWDIEKDWIVPIAGIVPALKQCVQAFTRVGDEVLVFKPVYHPFDESVLGNDRCLVCSALDFDEKTGHYSINFESLERLLEKRDVKMMIFCSPHNPVGRIWTEEELKKLAEIVKRYNIMVVSDEIHMDLQHHGKHIPFLKAAPELKEDIVICTAPSKTFNLAGLNTSNLVIPSEERRRELSRIQRRNGSETPNLFGLRACEAAYENGDQWVDELNEYISGNEAFIKDWLKEHLPMVHPVPMEGTYLMWLDFRQVEPDPVKLEELMLEKAHVWLDEGYIFGDEGNGFERVNLACSRALLKKALERIEKAVKEREV